MPPQIKRERGAAPRGAGLAHRGRIVEAGDRRAETVPRDTVHQPGAVAGRTAADVVSHVEQGDGTWALRRLAHRGVDVDQMPTKGLTRFPPGTRELRCF